MADLNDAFDDYNAWADENGINDLTIYLLTPNFYSEDFEFDVIGLNFWPTGAAFGSGNARMAGDPDSLASFDGVVDCAAHSLYALVGVKPPTQDPQTGGLFEFTDCTMQGGRSNDEGIAAVAAASQLFSQWNLNDAHAAMFNIAGLPPDTSYQFKWVTYYPSYETWGSLFDNIVTGGHVQTLGAMLDPVMRCNSSRIYSTSVMRTAAVQ
ncbi:MAG TPA: hypothetical protein VMR74_06200 [Gammaproteobacteria bacterium]|nr:hypothetical protein [Gammaproteobacteria bacterium]